MEAAEEGPHYSSTDLEHFVLFQPCPYITHLWSELGQGKVCIWISDEDGHECWSPHLWTHLGFPTLITALCMAWGVTLDSLTFESLSPAINLSYIKKNCWNLDDPTVSFLGTRKTRARGSEGLSSATPQTSTAPALIPSEPVPATSNPSAQSTDLMMAML